MDQHFSTSIPVLNKGKSIYVEWPLGRNLSEAEQLLSLAKENNVKFAQVGLQARQSPTVTTLKKLLESGRIGKVLSSTYLAAVEDQGHTQTQQKKYQSQMKVGGNVMTIHFGHIVDTVQNGE